ncbi:hypothetical protein Kuura_011 [Caulobacter phage Kuura]|nr:hypothetical protein Kuura_011 [Caulobacter phage Kuura]
MPSFPVFDKTLNQLSLELSTRRLTRFPNWAVEGDSRLAAASAYTKTGDIITAAQFQQRGVLTHLRRLIGQRVDFPVTMNYAVPSTTSADMLARLTTTPILADLTSGRAEGVLALMGTNDRGSANMTAKQTIDNFMAWREQILATGARILWLAELPRGEASFTAMRLASPQLDNHLTIHRWLLAQAGIERSFVANCWPAFANPASTTGDVKSGLTYDGLHPNGAGGVAMAPAPAAWFNAEYPPVNILPSSNSDVWSATNPRGSLSPNPMTLGTGGSKVAGGSTISGEVADSHTVTGVSATGLTIVCSKETVNGEEFQKIVISGTPTVSGVNVELSANIPVASLTADAVTGDMIYGVAQIDVPAGNTGWNGLVLGTRFLTVSGTPTTLSAQDGSVPVPSTQVGSAEAQPGPLRTSPVRISQAINSASAANARVRVIVYPILNVACSVTVRIRCLSAFKDVDNLLLT